MSNFDKNEVYVLVGALLFVLAVSAGAYFSEGRMWLWSGTSLPSSFAYDCAKELNKKLPYCKEREARIRKNWEVITRYQDRESPAFTLWGKE